MYAVVMKKTDPIQIREASLEDVDAIAALYYNTIGNVNERDYTPDQIAAWAGAAPEPDKWRKRLAGRQTFVACLEDIIVGFAEFEADGHIDAFYVHQEHQGEGIGTRLLNRIEQEAEQAAIDRLYTEASITALPFFEKRGFVVVQPQEVEYRGMKFRNYRMEKRRSS